MSYPKSFWTPNEDDAGKYWRLFYNTYLAESITAETIERIVSDLHPNWGKEHSQELAELRLGYSLFLEQGSQTFEGIMKIARASQEATSGPRDDLLMKLEDTIVHKRYRWADASDWHSLFALLDLDSLFDAAASSLPGDLLERVKRHCCHLKKKLGRDLTNIMFDRVFDRTRIIFEFSIFKTIVEHTWAGEDGFGAWTGEEYYFINEYYSSRLHWLGTPAERILDDVPTIDPADVDISTSELQPPWDAPGFSIWELFGQHIHTLVCDFIDEIILFNRHDSVRGSAQCKECGQFFARSFYGHGQKYCSNQCKTRAAKRRHREKRALEPYNKRKLK